MFKPLRAAAIAAVTLALSTGALAQSRAKLTVYSALENEQLAPFKAAIEKAVPEVEVEWVRDSTGVITARFLAEKDNPKADMILGLAASSMLLFEQANLLETYTPAGSEQLRATFKDNADPKTWTGMDAFLGVICFNTVEAKKAGITQPAPAPRFSRTAPDVASAPAAPGQHSAEILADWGWSAQAIEKLKASQVI